MSLPNFTNYAGKVAVVTGGGGVLCADMAKALLKPAPRSPSLT